MALTDQWLRQLYEVERRSVSDIARMYRLKPQSVSRYLQVAGVRGRPAIPAQRQPRKHVYLVPRFSLACLSDTDKGYLAGFIDGEGSVGITSRRTGDGLTPAVCIANTHLPTMNFLSGLFGHVVLRSTVQAKPGTKLLYRLEFKAVADVLHLLEVIYPCLITKRREADVVMRFCRVRLSRLRAGQVRVSLDEWALYQDFVVLKAMLKGSSQPEIVRSSTDAPNIVEGDSA